jgi:ribonuclease J
LRLDFFELPELISIQPDSGSCYIRSVTEPIDEEDMIDLKRVEEWLNMFGLFPYEKIHASGHLSGIDLKQMIQEINPKYLIPIHTEKPELFKDIVGADTEVIIPNYGVPIAF